MDNVKGVPSCTPSTCPRLPTQPDVPRDPMRKKIDHTWIPGVSMPSLLSPLGKPPSRAAVAKLWPTGPQGSVSPFRGAHKIQALSWDYEVAFSFLVARTLALMVKLWAPSPGQVNGNKLDSQVVFFTRSKKIIKMPVSLDGNVKINFHVSWPQALACRHDLLWLTGSTRTRTQSSPGGKGLVAESPADLGLLSICSWKNSDWQLWLLQGIWQTFSRKQASEPVTRRKTIDSARSGWSRWSSPKEIRIFEKRVSHAKLDSFPTRQGVSDEVGGDGKRCGFKTLYEKRCQIWKICTTSWMVFLLVCLSFSYWR